MMDLASSGSIPYEKSRERPLDGLTLETPYHVIGYQWEGEHPVWTLLPLRREEGLLLKEGVPVEIDLVEGPFFPFRISGSRRCIGRFLDGEHIPCPNCAPIEIFPQCRDCMSFDIPVPECVFEPRCNEGSCGAFFCQADHVVYITSFRGRFKVGMTQLARFETRGREQGADLIMPLMVLGDRYSARKVESAVSGYLGLPQSVSSNTKVKGWSQALRTQEQASSLLRLKRLVSEGWESIEERDPEDVNILRSPEDTEIPPVRLTYPMKEPLEAPPRMYKGPIVRGELIGYKGNYMLFRSGGVRAFRIGITPGSVVYLERSV
ncbi:MAG: DUF2797 domain-containing protein [Thermoplasmatota archaeon]